MAYPEVVTREEWLAARKRLLAAEKEQEDWEEPKGRRPGCTGRTRRSPTDARTRQT